MAEASAEEEDSAGVGAEAVSEGLAGAIQAAAEPEEAGRFSIL